MKGRPRGSRNNPFADELAKVLKEETTCPRDKTKKTRRIRAIATKLAMMAEEGDMGAIKEVTNRTDGRPLQAVDMEVVTNPHEEKSEKELAAEIYKRLDRLGDILDPEGAQDPDGAGGTDAGAREETRH